MTAASSDSQDHIYGDRRAGRRFPVALDLRYRDEKQVERVAITRDISSGGVLFSCGEVLPSGSIVELSIEWPVLLHGTQRMRLKVYGRVVRSDKQGTAIRTIRREFFTAGHAKEAVEQPLACAAGQMSAWPGSMLQ